MDDELSSAVKLYLGYGANPFPRENPEAVATRYGADASTQVRTIVQDAGRLQPNWEKHSLLSAKGWAEDEMRRRHPELNAAAVAALGWAFSFWWK